MGGNDEHTILLIHGNQIADVSAFKRELSNDNAEIKDIDGAFFKKAIYFDGSSKIDLPIGGYFNFGNGDFTVDWREYIPDASVLSGCPFAFNANPPFLIYYSGYAQIWYTLSHTGAYAGELNAGVWKHRAFVKKGSTLYAFYDGILVWTGETNESVPYDPWGYQMCIGGRSDVPQFFKGYIEEFRVSDIARWDAGFTPPDKPYEGYPFIIPRVDSAVITPNPVDFNAKFVLSVSVSEETVTLEPYYYYSGEIYAGEV